MPTLTITNLSKSYGSLKAVNDLSLVVEQGDVFGLLGPNGSGKTTTLGILLGILHHDDGSFQWFDQEDQDQARLKIGALLETPNFYPYLNAIDNLKIIARIKGIKKFDAQPLLQLVDLAHRSQSAFKTYSYGMKQRLAIAAAMVADPEVLILDEPTNGLDPQGIAEVRNIITRIAKTGKTIIMASHILDEVERVCSHVAIIKNGRLLASGPVGTIINQDVQIEIHSPDNTLLLELLQNKFELKIIHQQNEQMILQMSEDTSTATINQLAFDNNIVLSHLSAKKKSLETEFLEITGKAKSAK